MKKLYKIIILILIITMIFFSVAQNIYGATSTQKIGDINGDGQIDIVDTMRILEHTAASTIPKIRQKYPNWILKDDKFTRADINGDGVVDQRDTLRTLEYIASTTIPKIGKKHPEWKTYLESRWTPTEVTGIVFEKTNVVIAKGGIYKINARIIPTNAINKILTWSSSDQKIATVDGIGNVTGISKGIAIITAKAKNGIYKTMEVEVRETTPTPTPTPSANAKNIANTSITLKTTSFTYNGRQQTPEVIIKDGSTVLSKNIDYTVEYINNINVGTATIRILGKGKYTGTATKTFAINKATYNTSYLNFRDATYTYDGKAHSITATGVPTGVSVTYIGNNKINAGQYTVTAQFNVNANYNPIPNKTAKLTINKRNIASTSISAIDKKAYTGKAITPSVTIKYGSIVLKNGTDYTVQYKDNVKVGNAKAVITGKGNYTGTITKTFSIVTVKATKIVTSGQTYRLVEKGKTVQLTAKVSPDNSTYKTITWTSSNPKVVTVNSTGTIHVIAHGTAKITATQKESKVSATYTIVGYTPPKSISLNKASTTIYTGAKETLTATFNPTTISSNEITWTSSSPNVVSVDSSKTTNKKVTITAKNAGTATITATHKYGKKATCKVSVITDVTAVIGNPINVKSGFLKDSHNGMRYIKSIPENPTENMPLIIFLHGDGEEDSMSKLEKLPISQYVKSKTAYKAGKFVFIAPLRTSGHWASGSTLNKLMSVIEKTIKEYKIDRNRIILTGMSSGGNATWNIACKYQNFFAGIVPMSAKTGGASARKLTNLPIYGICGNKTSDEKERNRQMRKLLNEINKKNGRIITKLEVHENARHGTIQQYYKSYNLFRWMLSQRRNSNK